MSSRVGSAGRPASGIVTARSNRAWSAASSRNCWWRTDPTNTYAPTPEEDRRQRHEGDERER